MKTVTFIRVSSGFGNVYSPIVPKHTYEHSALSSRNNSGWDNSVGTYELPDDIEAIDMDGETIITDSANNIWNPGIEDDGTVWISDGKGHIRFLRKAKSDS